MKLSNSRKSVWIVYLLLAGAAAEVPDTSLLSFNSNEEEKFLYEMQALQKELYEQIDSL